MRILKTFGLGTLLFFLISVALTVIWTMTGKTQVQYGHATGLSAVRGGMLEALYSPLFWLAILISYGGAFWLVKR